MCVHVIQTNTNTMRFNRHSYISAITQIRAYDKSCAVPIALEDQRISAGSGRPGIDSFVLSIPRAARRRLIYIYPLLQYIRRPFPIFERLEEERSRARGEGVRRGVAAKRGETMQGEDTRRGRGEGGGREREKRWSR